MKTDNASVKKKQSLKKVACKPGFLLHRSVLQHSTFEYEPSCALSIALLYGLHSELHFFSILIWYPIFVYLFYN